MVPDPTDWPLKISNLKKLQNNLVEYYRFSLNQRLEGVVADVDLSIIAKEEDIDSNNLVKLFQQVLGCAVQCDDRATYIGNIMNLSQESQVVLKEMIETTMQSILKLEDAPDRNTQNNNEGSLGGEEMEISFGDHLDDQNDSEDRRQLNETIVTLQTKNSTSEKEIQELQNKLIMSQQELADLSASNSQMTMVETLVDDLHKRLEERDTDIAEMKDKLKVAMGDNAEYKTKYKKTESDNRLLADENDILTQKAEQLVRAEKTIEKYKNKLEEASGMKAHIGEIEEQSSKYVAS